MWASCIFKETVLHFRNRQILQAHAGFRGFGGLDAFTPVLPFSADKSANQPPLKTSSRSLGPWKLQDLRLADWLAGWLAGCWL